MIETLPSDRTILHQLREIMILAFVLPLIGTFVLTFANPIYGLIIAFSFALAPFLTVITIYYFGLIPSLATGCVFATLRHRLHPGVTVIVVTLTGLCTAALWLGWSQISRMNLIAIFSNENLMYLLATSGMASMIIALPDYLHHLGYHRKPS